MMKKVLTIVALCLTLHGIKANAYVLENFEGKFTCVSAEGVIPNDAYSLFMENYYVDLENYVGTVLETSQNYYGVENELYVQKLIPMQGYYGNTSFAVVDLDNLNAKFIGTRDGSNGCACYIGGKYFYAYKYVDGVFSDLYMQWCEDIRRITIENLAIVEKASFSDAPSADNIMYTADKVVYEAYCTPKPATAVSKVNTETGKIDITYTAPTKFNEGDADIPNEPCLKLQLLQADPNTWEYAVVEEQTDVYPGQEFTYSFTPDKYDPFSGVQFEIDTYYGTAMTAVYNYAYKGVRVADISKITAKAQEGGKAPVNVAFTLPSAEALDGIKLTFASLKRSDIENSTVEVKRFTEGLEPEAILTYEDNDVEDGQKYQYEVRIGFEYGYSSGVSTEVCYTQPDYAFCVSDQVARKGRVTMLPVEMKNVEGIVSFQCDVVLPEGVNVHKEDGSYSIATSDRFDNTHTLISSQLADGKIRIVSISMQNHAYKGNDGVLFSIPIEVDESLADESVVTLTIENIQLTKTNLEKYVADALTAYLTIGRKFTPGDVNDDGEFTILDASMVIAYILQQDPVNGILEAADVNGDGEISVLDASLVISYILEDRPVALSTSTNRIAKQTPTESAHMRIIEDGKAYLAIPNASRFVAAQFELTVHDVISVSAIKLVGDNASSHTLAWKKREDGTIKAVVFSHDNSRFTGDELIEISYESNGICCEIVASDVQMTSIEDGCFYETSFTKAIAYADESGIASPTNGLQIITEGGNLIIISDKEMTLPLISVDGKSCILNVKSGSNTFSINNGFYIVNNKKIFAK